jgi:hypothetical protein
MPYHALAMADGSVAIMQTVGAATPAACLRKWPAAEQARVVAVAAIARDAIPADRTFRNAWTLAGGEIVHDMAKARDIKRDQLRAERVPLLAALDAAYLRADEAGDAAAKSAIAAEKQKLRDAPDHLAIAAAATVADLKAITLAEIAAGAVVVGAVAPAATGRLGER